MKNIFSLVIGLLCSCAIFAQAPNSISYQANLRRADGSLVALIKVNFQFTIHKNSANGPVVYEETQSVMTNRDGLATLRIGAGAATTGNFSAIDWSTGLYFVRTKIDLSGGTNFLLFSVGQLSSVPYAFFATEAGSIDYANVKHAPDVAAIQSNVDSLQNSIDSLLARVKSMEQAKGLSGLSVTDIEGNVYPLVSIGGQVWMAENLRVTKFNDGTPLTEVISSSWELRSDPIYCWPNNDSTTYSALHAGRLYNGFTAYSSKNICPVGFRLPTIGDFVILRTFLGVDVPATDLTFAAKNADVFQKLSSNNVSLAWNALSGQKSVGFNALPLGDREDNPNFVVFGSSGITAFFMTTTNLSVTPPPAIQMTEIAAAVLTKSGLQLQYIPRFAKFGSSVRCIKQ